jgi:hypothetical protein
MCGIVASIGPPADLASAVREALTTSFEAGLRVSAVTSAGAYVLTPEETP